MPYLRLDMLREEEIWSVTVGRVLSPGPEGVGRSCWMRGREKVRRWVGKRLSTRVAGRLVALDGDNNKLKTKLILRSDTDE